MIVTDCREFFCNFAPQLKPHNDKRNTNDGIYNNWHQVSDGRPSEL